MGMNPSAGPASGAFLANAMRFIYLLRQAGLTVSISQTAAWLEALTLIHIGDRAQVQRASRALLVTRRDDLPTFDLLFHVFFGGGSGPAGRPQRAPRAPRHDPGKGRMTIASYLAAKAHPADPEVDVADRAETYSPAELLNRKAFSAMSDEELESVRLLIRDFRWQVARRRTRRWEPAPRGHAVALRQAIRRAARSGHLPSGIPRRRQREKPRPVVLLADISGSMERYGRIILQFFHALFRMEGNVEAFVFGTRLTRITPALRIRNPDRALDRAAREVVDWAGGTRIGASLEQFHDTWGRRVLRRGAVVVVVSDGWDRGEPDRLRGAMAHLWRRCHRLLWLNPHLGGDGYEPAVEGMRTALPFIDDFLPIRNFHDLRELAALLSAVPRRRPPRRSVVTARQFADLRVAGI